jgi:iron(II)-dependent oxidoreductase
MHDEALTYTRQTHGYAAPAISTAAEDGNTPGAAANPPSGDAEIPGGMLMLGSTPDSGFVFDNEQWAHPVEVAPFAMSRTAVTNAQFAEFAGDRGYDRRELWSNDGWAWRERTGARHPVYWCKENGGWLRRDFDQWVTLEAQKPVIHVNWYEAQAYCAWAKRRLPTEAEWEMAAAMEPGGKKRLYPWGDETPTPDRANLDGRNMGCIDVNALPAGDSAFGVRQMIGNVWEWTADAFGPYPRFAPGPYKEYSAPWFGDHKVLRGGCWVTRSRLIRNAYRNFYTPDRRDVWAGFRTCAL